MGLSASQARFLQLTARRSDIEYEAQQINFQRLQLADKLSDASRKYQDATTNRKMVFSYNTGSEIQKVDVTYANYKNYMNKQLEGVASTQAQYFLVSSSGNRLVVSSEEERDELISKYSKEIDMDLINAAKSAYEEAQIAGTVSNLDALTIEHATMDLKNCEIKVIENEDGSQTQYVLDRRFKEEDFLIVDDLDDPTNFQNAIQNGTYYFATLNSEDDEEKGNFSIKGWETLGGGAISEDYDKSDDAKAEAEYQTEQDRIHAIDRKLELKLDQLESNRQAIQTEIESVQKVVDDNIQNTFKSLG